MTCTESENDTGVVFSIAYESQLLKDTAELVSLYFSQGDDPSGEEKAIDWIISNTSGAFTELLESVDLDEEGLFGELSTITELKETYNHGLLVIEDLDYLREKLGGYVLSELLVILKDTPLATSLCSLLVRDAESENPSNLTMYIQIVDGNSYGVIVRFEYGRELAWGLD